MSITNQDFETFNETSFADDYLIQGGDVLETFYLGEDKYVGVLESANGNFREINEIALVGKLKENASGGKYIDLKDDETQSLRYQALDDLDLDEATVDQVAVALAAAQTSSEVISALATADLDKALARNAVNADVSKIVADLIEKAGSNDAAITAIINTCPSAVVAFARGDSKSKAMSLQSVANMTVADVTAAVNVMMRASPAAALELAYNLAKAQSA